MFLFQIMKVRFFTGLEFVSSKYRMVVGVVIQMFFSVGFLLTSGFAYAFHENWRYFQLAITIPTLFYTTYYWSVVRVLVSHRQSLLKQIFNLVPGLYQNRCVGYWPMVNRRTPYKFSRKCAG